ncbi:FG-GAP-like repeat-containing protein [Candidatus Auribacterota bacterium]
MRENRYTIWSVSEIVIARTPKADVAISKIRKIQRDCFATLAMTVIIIPLLLCTSASLLFASPDINSDGYPDIVLSSYYNETFNTNSKIYWGAETSPYTTNTNIATKGQYGNAVADLNSDGYQDIVFATFKGGPGMFDANSFVYWGAATAPYTTKTEMPTHGAYGCSIADLNDDGHLDIVFANKRNTAGAFNINSYIYWGAESDPYVSKSELSTNGANASSVGDLNKDGYLDVVFSSGAGLNSFIYWGAASNSFTSKTEMPTTAALGSSVADLNNDGYLDIVFTNTGNPKNSYIYWGDESEPYTSKTDFITNDGYGNSIGDLNCDGYLDIVVSGYITNSYIYWGAETNPYTSTTELSALGSRVNALGDLNKDGYVDIVFSRLYKSDGGYNQNSYIYWGAETAPYTSKTEMPVWAGMGVSIVGGNIWAGNTGLGSVIPLWATQGDYSSEVLNSWEYGFIAVQNELLNSGALDLSDEEIAKLAKLYFDQSGTVEIDGIIWTYYSDEIGGHAIPEAWFEDDTYYFQMGSGLQGTPTPEPSTVVMMGVLLGLLFILRKRRAGLQPCGNASLKACPTSPVVQDGNMKK